MLGELEGGLEEFAHLQINRWSWLMAAKARRPHYEVELACNYRRARLAPELAYRDIFRQSCLKHTLGAGNLLKPV